MVQDEPNLSQYQILNYLVELEQYIGKDNYVLYKPQLQSTDIVEIQKEAKRVMDFLGLNDYLPIVSFVKTIENTGGNIELNCNSDKAVLINISTEYRGDKDEVLTVLAHEICHKLLYVHGLYYYDDVMHNEILTDLATIYSGLALLTLNGCYKRVVNLTDKSIDGRGYETLCRSIGYLSLRQFVEAYHFVCMRFHIECSDYTNGIYNEMVLNVFKESWSRFYNDHNDAEKCNKKEIIKEIQSDDAELIKYITVMEDMLNQAKAIVQQRHKTFKSVFTDTFRYTEKESSKMQDLLYLFVHMQKHDNDKEIRYFTSRLKSVEEAICYDNNINTIHAINSVLTITCPICGYQKRDALKDYKSIILKCPSCKYTFLWDANSIVPVTPTQNANKKDNPSSSSSLKDKIKKLFS